jgi:hypothetical protein
VTTGEERGWSTAGGGRDPMVDVSRIEEEVRRGAAGGGGRSKGRVRQESEGVGTGMVGEREKCVHATGAMSDSETGAAMAGGEGRTQEAMVGGRGAVETGGGRGGERLRSGSDSNVKRLCRSGGRNGRGRRTFYVSKELRAGTYGCKPGWRSRAGRRTGGSGQSRVSGDSYRT